MHEEHPEALSQLSSGHAYDMSTNIFERLPQIFYDEKPNDGAEYIKILGREKNERVYKYIKREYVNDVINLDKYKILIPKANGIGAFRRGHFSSSNTREGNCHTETFLSIGMFDNIQEAQNAYKYIKSKFARALLEY